MNAKDNPEMVILWISKNSQTREDISPANNRRLAKVGIEIIGSASVKDESTEWGKSSRYLLDDNGVERLADFDEVQRLAKLIR